MIKIEPEEKIINIDFEIIQENIFKLLQDILYDLNQNMTDEIFQHSYKKLAYILKNQYKSLSWIDIECIFDSITNGIYDIKKISVTNILWATNEYIKKKRNKNRIEYERRGMEERQELGDDLSKCPRGMAILFRHEQRENGNYYWEQFSQKEIAEKIASGEIQYHYISYIPKRMIINKI